jgi:hypothetical protein
LRESGCGELIADNAECKNEDTPGDRRRAFLITEQSLHITSGAAETPLAPKLALAESAGSTTDPELARVLAAWPKLPDSLKAAVLAIVKSATAEPAQSTYADCGSRAS